MDPKIRLAYFSKAQREMSLDDIQSILNTARENNAASGISGMLCYESKWFLQVLEGERSVVTELFIDIADDPRHDEISLVSMDYFEEPKFRDWQMGYVASAVYFEQALKECGLSSFEPGEMSPEVCLELLQRLSEMQNDAEAA